MPRRFSKPHLSRVINGDIEEKQDDQSAERPRLDVAATAKYPEYNRSTIQKFIRSGYISVDAVVVDKPNTLVDLDSDMVLDIPDKEETIDIPTIYEDRHVIVFDKPAGILSISKSPDNIEPTVADLLPDPKLLAHRLDRGTSGVIIGAKDAATHGYLQRQFQERKVHKVYYCIVVGHPKLPEAVIDLPIARNLKSPTTFRIDPNGRNSITEYKVIKSNDKYSLLELRPRTGRTHQIRVHLAYIGTPILGDTTYGAHEALRIMLHAHSLEITIPGVEHGERRTFTSPMPEDFERVFD